MNPSIVERFWFPFIVFALFMAAMVFRPLLPIDETRYMSVAWEMRLHSGWLDPLTKNFEPYHHKPPLLFWLINAFWSVFGVSRWAGTIPLVLASGLTVFLTTKLASMLAGGTEQEKIYSPQRVMLIMAASLPFLAYGTLVMFDCLMMVFVLLGLIFTIRFARERRIIDLILLGLCLGFGVLTKGPVAYLYVLPFYLLAPVWNKDLTRKATWYGSVLLAILVSAIPVLFWLIPVLKESDNHFAFWLLWEQTAGRVTGNFSASHARPFYFYLMLLPAFLIPWIFFPSVWRSFKTLHHDVKSQHVLLTAVCFAVPVFIAFSFISGKQPHYMVPLTPAMILFFAFALREIQTKRLAQVMVVMVALIIGGQAIASQTVFKKYDLAPIVEYIDAHRGHDLAYVSNYHAEFGFLARLDKKVDDVMLEDLEGWFADHLNGWAVIRFSNPAEVEKYDIIFDMKYRGRDLAIIQTKK